ncbi:transposase [Moraxella equi]|uniref:transposase n=1 Tax=Moraxella equi TaxID=60442 RepID=UPI0030B86885
MELRQQFVKQLEQYKQDNRPIVYLDESGFRGNTHRPYAYAHQSQRCYGTYNWQAKNQTNAIGAIYNNKLFAVGLYECSINSQVYQPNPKYATIPLWHTQMILDNKY